MYIKINVSVLFLFVFFCGGGGGGRGGVSNSCQKMFGLDFAKMPWSKFDIFIKKHHCKTKMEE